MASFDDLDAPQFSTFDDDYNEDTERYFHKNCEDINTTETNEEVFFSPEQEIPESFLNLRSRNVKRSSSSGNIPISLELSKSLENVQLNSNQEHNEGQSSRKQNIVYSNLNNKRSMSQSKIKYCSQDSLNRLAAPKSLQSSRSNLSNIGSEYVSVAESIKRFHEKTPTRFHTQKKNTNLQTTVPFKLKATIPHSPFLQTKKRMKSASTVLSQQEREQLEFEEAQKNKFKANPLNKKVLQPMKAIHLERKPVTQPEPFKLTKIESKKTAPSPKKDEVHFHAKPIPKYLSEPVKLPKKQPPKVTTPIEPSFFKNIAKPSPIKKIEPKICSLPLEKTRPQPFSFEKRDLKLLTKKEERIQKVLLEEKKAREFHARPIPKPIISLINEQKQKSNGSMSSSSSNDEKKCNDNIIQEFKAKPALVLHQKPFEVKRTDQPLVEIQPFQLHSELRAKEREIFERKKKEMEKMSAEIERLEEEDRIKKEEEEIRKLREEITFKAQPIKNFKKIVIKPSGKVTEPKSPVFCSGTNKENKQ